MSDTGTRAHVQALCAAAGLPVTDGDLDALTPLFERVTRDIEELASLIDPKGEIPLRYQVSS